ncbi:MAG: 4-hydroxythreonine-4-phosphate dehydrogenase PdxA [Pseudomonadota bacterium]
MRENLAPLALTMGEPGGVGPEITAKVWRALREGGPFFFVIADPGLFDSAETVVIKTPHEVSEHFRDRLPVMPLQQALRAEIGVADPASAPAVLESIETAVRVTLSGEAAAVVTNPIQKASLIAAGFAFPGHTEYLQSLTAEAPMPAGRARGAVMMLASDALRTVPVTVHQSVVDAAKNLRPDMIVEKGVIAAQSLRDDFGVEAPRLAVSALNPHAGEAGAMGYEDAMIIAPAIDELRALGVDVRGPLPADTMFHEEARARYDAALCMLHDQALIPVKTLAFHDAVNATLGLPIIRTSPDHGVALDIAGKGLARPDSLIASIKLAAKLAARRQVGE